MVDTPLDFLPFFYLINISDESGEIDSLTGQAGIDTFVLRDQIFRGTEGPSYVFKGNSDYALITDFNKGEDVIELATNERTFTGTTTVEYSLGASPEGLPGGTALYVDNLGTKPDLIAILQGVGPNSVSLTDSYFKFV